MSTRNISLACVGVLILALVLIAGCGPVDEGSAIAPRGPHFNQYFDGSGATREYTVALYVASVFDPSKEVDYFENSLRQILKECVGPQGELLPGRYYVVQLAGHDSTGSSPTGWYKAVRIFRSDDITAARADLASLVRRTPPEPPPLVQDPQDPAHRGMGQGGPPMLRHIEQRRQRGDHPKVVPPIGTTRPVSS